MTTEQFEQFRATLHRLATELEDLWIEKEAYVNFILTLGMATPEYLKHLADTALANPEIRQQTREQFSGMWKALEETGTDAWIEDFLHMHPQSEKPN